MIDRATLEEDLRTVLNPRPSQGMMTNLHSKTCRDSRGLMVLQRPQPKASCPLCGRLTSKSAMKRHQDRRRCRQQVIINLLKAQGWHAERNLDKARTVRALRWPHLRIPARPQAHPTRVVRWETPPPAPLPALGDAYYDGLGDTLFLREWSTVLLRISHDRVQLSNHKEHSELESAFLIRMTPKLLAVSDEVLQAVVVMYHLAGHQSAFELLAAGPSN